MSDDNDHPFLKLVAVSLVLFAGYNAFIKLPRGSAYEALYFQQDKASVIKQMGWPAKRSECATRQPEITGQVEIYCQQEGVTEVVQFQLCLIGAFCKPILFTAFNKDGKMLYKSRLE